ncbi:MAG: hypothetical protein IKL49_11450 [Lachnospiraceae bacterium]|nr:hypothetical protein [Lachnospiraceae bacterium]
MNRIWLKRAVALLVFVISLFVVDFILNKDNSELTMDMPKATLPVVSVLSGEYKINTMYGYTSRREEAYTKDSITPISDDRKISLVIDTFQADIESVAYEVRSVDGDRLIEGSDITVLQKMPDKIQFSIQLKDLTEENKEYSFVTILTMEDGEKVYYYTRFIQSENYYEKEKLDFITFFHNTTFSDDGTEIKKYLESNSQADNNNFHKVDIHSSLPQVMWDMLSIEKVEEPVILIKDITTQTAGVVLKYLVKETGIAEDNYYFIEEYYRVRYTPNRMYLLDYERTMDEIFGADKNSFSNDKIYLGITDEQVSMVESEGGKNLAFINANRLFVYNNIDNKLSEVFSFYNKNNFDMRTRNRDFDIKILKMEDSGSLTFMVSGYMNRGTHEGDVGVIVYYYDTTQNAIEEQIFIPYSKSADILIRELDNLCYLNLENHLFLILEGRLYDINLEQKNYELVISNLTEDTYKVSKSGRMISWLKENTPYSSSSLYWMNMNDGKQLEIKAGYGEYISILGFIEEDLIYGLVSKDMVKTETNGNVLFPIHKLLIRSQDNKILKNYYKEGNYIIDCNIVDNQITLKRIQISEQGEYRHIEDDHIASSGVQDKNVTKVSIINNDVYKKTIQLILKNTVNPNSIKIMTPREVIFEGGREVILDMESTGDYFYVYGPKGVEKITNSSAEAVDMAYELSGSVLDASGNYIWKKGTVYSRNQIMAITGTKRDNENGSIAVCLDSIMKLEGISMQTQPLLDAGEDVLNIMKDSLRKEKILDLRGCPLDTVLFYVDQDIPVLALVDNKDAYLIIGFNEFNIVLMDPKQGTVYKKGMNDSREMFEKNGNQFITYMRYE